MATSFPTPPTFANPVVVDAVTQQASFNPIWLRWFLDFAQLLQNASTGVGVQHENLSGLQGGALNEHFHFTNTEHINLSGYAGTLPTAAIVAFFGTPSSANLIAAVTDETGTGALVFATSPALVTPLLGTPTSGTLTNCTGLPVNTGISGLATGIAAFLATPSSANLIAAVTDETGAGALVFANTPALVTPDIGAATGASLVATSYVKTGSTTVASLPAAATAGAGARMFVTDATATTFLSIVAGTGANKVPVVSNGINWLIG